jgi:cation diffusion facilitator family transporter
MAAAVVGIVGNRVVARYKGRFGRRIRSATLVTDAHHSRLDAFSSLGALLGLIGVAAGLPWADGVAGPVVTGFIVQVGWTVTKEIVVHLMDGVEPEVPATAERAALTIAGVDHVHVRGRWAGRSLLVEIEGFLAGDRSIDDAERVGHQVRQAVVAAVPAVRAVMWSPHSLSRHVVPSLPLPKPEHLICARPVGLDTTGSRVYRRLRRSGTCVGGRPNVGDGLVSGRRRR